MVEDESFEIVLTGWAFLERMPGKSPAAPRTA